MNSDYQDPVYVLGLCIAPGAEAAATADAVAVARDFKKKILRKRREDQRAERQVGPLRQGRLGPNYHARQISRGRGGAAVRGRALTGVLLAGVPHGGKRVYFIARGRLRKCAWPLNIMNDAETLTCSTA